MSAINNTVISFCEKLFQEGKADPAFFLDRPNLNTLEITKIDEPSIDEPSTDESSTDELSIDELVNQAFINVSKNNPNNPEFLTNLEGLKQYINKKETKNELISLFSRAKEGIASGNNSMHFRLGIKSTCAKITLGIENRNEDSNDTDPVITFSLKKEQLEAFKTDK